MVTPEGKKNDSLLACLQSPVIFQKTSEPYLYFVNKSFEMNLDVKARIDFKQFFQFVKSKIYRSRQS